MTPYLSQCCLSQCEWNYGGLWRIKGQHKRAVGVGEQRPSAWSGSTFLTAFCLPREILQREREHFHATQHVSSLFDSDPQCSPGSLWPNTQGSHDGFTVKNLMDEQKSYANSTDKTVSFDNTRPMT